VRVHRELLREPPVDVVGEILGPVRGDRVVQRHPRGDDEVIRSQVQSPRT
jgi:hypothetical protein